MNDVIKNRSEIVFLYDVTNANPNGDPDENKPRMDEGTDINLVSDTRLKRTVRDYMAFRRKESSNNGGYRIFVLPERKEDGTVKTKGERVSEIVKQHPEFIRERKGKKKIVDGKKLEEYLKKEYIDLRLFGATLALGEEATVPSDDFNEADNSGPIAEEDAHKAKGAKDEISIDTMKWMGPVQFKFGHSLHKVEPVLLKGTTVESSEVGKTMGTFTEFWYVPYSLIAFSGIVNEVNGEDMGVSDSDVSYLLDALWNGTKGLITRSKVGQVPRLLMQVVYDGHFHIGNIDRDISLAHNDGKKIALSDNDGKFLRSISDLQVDLTGLISHINRNIKRVKELKLAVDSQVSFKIEEETVSADHLLDALMEHVGHGVKVTPLTF